MQLKGGPAASMSIVLGRFYILSGLSEQSIRITPVHTLCQSCLLAPHAVGKMICSMQASAETTCRPRCIGLAATEQSTYDLELYQFDACICILLALPGRTQFANIPSALVCSHQLCLHPSACMCSVHSHLLQLVAFSAADAPTRVFELPVSCGIVHSCAVRPVTLVDG